MLTPFAQGTNNPRAMILEAVPVIPPDLRPMVQLDGGRFATSDLNDLYRRVINRNNRLKRLLDLGAPEIIVNNEKRMLQEAVDALFDNGRRGRAVTGPGSRPLKSLSDMLKGKQGRFRQNLLGKRVDYSGRSVIVVGPQLRLHQCGLPKAMALELFKPFVMKRLVDQDLAQNIKAAKRMVERQRPQVWDVLKDVIQEHPVLLNRAPTLHRLGIQAFEPVLVEGKAIQIHPLVCEAFNADFDGDQMAVHVPLSAEAQAEARVLMLSTNNVLSPAHGRPIVTPSQDMVIGIYYLSEKEPGEPGEGRAFSDIDEAQMAYDLGELGLHAPIRLRVGELAGDPARRAQIPEQLQKLFDPEPVDGSRLIETTLGRALINQAFPLDFPYVNATVMKSDVKALIEDVIEEYDKTTVERFLDAIKDLGFRFSTRAGLTIGLDDVKTPADKPQILAEYEERAAKVETNYRRGVITDAERRQELIEIWTEATDRVKESMEETLKRERFNPIDMMVRSGARGNIMQVRQIAGMRGLVANPRGDIIPRPILSNFREGLSVLEYFISTHGARKGLADTALRTADSGYLTRRLVDVSQEVIIASADCETDRGITLTVRTRSGETIRNLRNRLFGRVLADDVKVERKLVDVPGGGKLKAGTMIGRRQLEAISAATGVAAVRVRSVLTCEERYGVCAACYGLSLATGRPVERGEAVGIVAAQSIGEPGTQLTMRTFHTGGVAGEDITHGLPRVVELFEARTPKGKAIIAEAGGMVAIVEDEASRKVVITGRRRSGARVPHLPVRPAAGAPRGEDRPGHPAHRGPARPQGSAGDPGGARLPAVPGRSGAGGVPQPGRGHPRQAHRDDRAPDAAPGEGGQPRRQRLPAGRAGGRPRVPRDQPRAGAGRQAPRRGASRAHGDHQGLAGHRLVAVGGFLPGDHPGADRGRPAGPVRLPPRAQGERDHRQAHPGRHGGRPLPGRAAAAARCHAGERPQPVRGAGPRVGRGAPAPQPGGVAGLSRRPPRCGEPGRGSRRGGKCRRGRRGGRRGGFHRVIRGSAGMPQRGPRQTGRGPRRMGEAALR